MYFNVTLQCRDCTCVCVEYMCVVCTDTWWCGPHHYYTFIVLTNTSQRNNILVLYSMCE